MALHHDGGAIPGMLFRCPGWQPAPAPVPMISVSIAHRADVSITRWRSPSCDCSAAAVPRHLGCRLPQPVLLRAPIDTGASSWEVGKLIWRARLTQLLQYLRQTRVPPPRA
jgi:hypothetical protein